MFGLTAFGLKAAPSHCLSCQSRSQARKVRLLCRASGSSGDGEDLDALFQQELERRKAAAGKAGGNGSNTTTSSSSSSGGGGPFGTPPPPPSFGRGSADTPPQLQKSRELNSEGLEGLVPRASELIKLGLAFTASFGPFIIAVGLAFLLIYSVFGSAFVHGGRPGVGGPPPYVDPELLLNEPTADPTVEFGRYPESFNPNM